jgi:GNAT superfamily N-acetyltransferase
VRSPRLSGKTLERMSSPRRSSRRLFATDAYEVVALTGEDLPVLQAFFVGNSEYFLAVTGAPPRPDEARQEFECRPPPGVPYDKVYVLGFLDSSGQMAAMASVLSDLLAPRVWHIGLFIVATALHGTGTAGLLYERLEKWAKDEGASWLRLGVVVGNAKAERFWEKAGYSEVRRLVEQHGSMTHTVRLMVKSLGSLDVAEYLREVPRDRPES